MGVGFAILCWRMDIVHHLSIRAIWSLFFMAAYLFSICIPLGLSAILITEIYAYVKKNCLEGILKNNICFNCLFYV